jgi:hypothetical protein
MSIDLVPLGGLHITIATQHRLGGVPDGTRLIGEAAECRWEGDRVHARQRGASAGDWVMIHSGPVVAVDARLLLETDDGALLTVRYTGRAAGPPAEGHPVLIAPTFEAADAQYAWLNTVQAVGKGLRDGPLLVYELYELC